MRRHVARRLLSASTVTILDPREAKRRQSELRKVYRLIRRGRYSKATVRLQRLMSWSYELYYHETDGPLVEEALGALLTAEPGAKHLQRLADSVYVEPCLPGRFSMLYSVALQQGRIGDAEAAAATARRLASLEPCSAWEDNDRTRQEWAVRRLRAALVDVGVAEQLLAGIGDDGSAAG